MDFEKKESSYKILATVVITAFVTFIMTLYGANYYYTKNDNKAKENLDKYISLSALSGEMSLELSKDMEDLEGEIKISDASKEVAVRIELVKRYIEENYLREIDEAKLIESAVKGYVRGLGDLYTEYLTEDEYAELMIDVNGNYVGIGIYMSQDKEGNIVIITPIEGSPAEAAGLKSGDIIVKVDGEECKGKDITITSNKIKGEEGTTVELEIYRDGETFETKIKRKTVVINYIKSEVLEGNIGYIEILSFDGKSSSDFKKHYEELKSKKIKSLIIDVRDNGGGLVSEVIKIAEMIAPKGSILMCTVDKDGNASETKSRTDDVMGIPIVLLVNEHSASASEILAGALKDNKLATLVGTTTYGKGIMQELFKLKSGGAMKITIQEFKTPNGDTIHDTGIEPDYVIEQPEDEEDNDVQLQKAIDILKGR